MFVLRAVRSTLLTSASNQTIREARWHRDGMDHRIEGHRTGQVIEGQVQSGAVVDQRVDLGVGLGAREIGIERRQHDLRHRQIERPCNLAGNHLGDERPHALSGGAELQHVHAVIVGFDDGRQ